MSPHFTKAPPQTGLPETESSVLKGQLTRLGLHSIAATFEAEADRASKSETSFTAYLGRLVELELADKADRSINARIARARFPVLRTLEQFDFSFQPSLGDEVLASAILDRLLHQSHTNVFNELRPPVH
jgi:DNA replication protein DnaC